MNVTPTSIPSPTSLKSNLKSEGFDITLEKYGTLYGALVLRLALGIVFIAHALLKLLVFSLAGTAQFFSAHGFPAWSAYPVFAIELVGGFLLIAGYFTRTVSLVLIPIMMGALSVYWRNGWNFTAPGGGWEYVAFLFAALIAQSCLGPGAFALSKCVAFHTREK